MPTLRALWVCTHYGIHTTCPACIPARPHPALPHNAPARKTLPSTLHTTPHLRRQRGLHGRVAQVGGVYPRELPRQACPWLPSAGAAAALLFPRLRPVLPTPSVKVQPWVLYTERHTPTLQPGPGKEAKQG